MKRYNIRVYALVIHGGEVLVSDEYRMGIRMTKFPGGGHEWGEGLADTVMRECMEEVGQEPMTVEHYYTTDFFVASAFREDDQLISIYYKVEFLFPEKIPTVKDAFAFAEEVEGAQVFRWVPLSELQESDMTFVIDQKVAGMLRADQQ